MANSLYKTYGTNRDYENNGVCLDFGGAKIWVRRAGGSNRAYHSALANRTSSVKNRLSSMSAEDQRKLLMEVYLDAVVLRWEGVTDEKGQTLVFSRENFIKVMSDLPDFWGVLVRECEELRNFQDNDVEADTKTLGE